MVSILAILLLPTLLALPQLTPWLKASPVYYVGGFTDGLQPGILAGVPYIDPNNGFQTQALGYRAALDWIHGVVPWWNPYSGVGLPLAAEYQPSAFFPLTLLVLLPRGAVFLQWALQVLAGLGTYALLRQLGMGRLAATTGGLLYAVNGTLAWFAHGPASAVPFLPWMLLGIERCACGAAQHVRGGWRTLALALGFSLLAGFPETAYINGLMALAWAMLRGLRMAPEHRLDFARHVVIGGAVGIALAAPQVLAFLLYLPDAHVGAHAGEFAYEALLRPSIITTLVAPYAFGPIFAYPAQWSYLAGHWGGVGGYAGLALVAAAAYGFCARRDALSVLLLAWTVATIAKSYAVEPFTWLWNLVPGVTSVAFARYAHPTWELALVILAAGGLDALRRGNVPGRAAWVAAAGAVAVIAAAALAYGAEFWPEIAPHEGLRHAALLSTAWALLTAAACLVLLLRGSARHSTVPLALLLAADAAILCAVPILSNPRGGTLDMRAIAFLQSSLGLQRFFTLGPIQPNYGAFFGIASINHNYLPVARRWTDHVKRHLDPKADPVVFNGLRDGAALRRNISAYEALGVKYVVAHAGSDPLAGVDGARRVYADNVVQVFELAGTKSYFEVLAGSCAVQGHSRTYATAECATPARLLRRELFFPGWRASVNGREAPISEEAQLFQAIELPAGFSQVRYSYAPTHIGWAWLAALLGTIAVLVPSAPRRR